MRRTDRQSGGRKSAIQFRLIAPGTFLMGSPGTEPDRGDSEWPLREVTITKPLNMGVYPVTQAQYAKVIGDNPSGFRCAERPVDNVSWHHAVMFCKKLSRISGHCVDLPTEAQWEYACRAGTTTPFSTGETISVEQANYNGDYV